MQHVPLYSYLSTCWQISKAHRCPHGMLPASARAEPPLCMLLPSNQSCLHRVTSAVQPKEREDSKAAGVTVFMYAYRAMAETTLLVPNPKP